MVIVVIFVRPPHPKAPAAPNSSRRLSRTLHGKYSYVPSRTVTYTIVQVVPKQLVELAEALRRDSTYRRQLYVPNAAEEHVIIGGHVTFSSIHDFIFDFFHEDHGLLRAKVLV